MSEINISNSKIGQLSLGGGDNVSVGPAVLGPMGDVLVYVAGPISKGGILTNVGLACDAGLRLIEAGVAAHVPHLTVFMGMARKGVYRALTPELLPGNTTIEQWYELALIQVRRCSAVLRLPGESRGADLEVAEMRRIGGPVFHAVEEVIAWARGREYLDG